MHEQKRFPVELADQVSGLLHNQTRGKETTEERISRNSILRQRIDQAPDAAIAWTVAANHKEGLVKRELLKRLEAGNDFPLYPLFDFATVLLSHGIAKKADHHWMDLIRKNIARVAPTMSASEVSQLIGDNISRIMERDTDFLEQTLSWRIDAATITEEIISQVPTTHESATWREELSMRLESIQDKATTIRTQREKKIDINK